MYINIIDETEKVSSALLEQTEKLLTYAADYIHLPENKEMSVTFVENVRSQAINKKFREVDSPTDVISLEYKPSTICFDEIGAFDRAEFDSFIGELYINIERAQEQAIDYGHSLAREYGWLTVHGFLHVNGHDHYTSEEEKEMFTLQEEILSTYGLTR